VAKDWAKIYATNRKKVIPTSFSALLSAFPAQSPYQHQASKDFDQAVQPKG